MATKKDLIASVTKRINYLPNVDIKNGIDLVIDYLKQQLAQQSKIEMRNFGSFSVRKRKKANSVDEYNTIYFRMAKSTASKVMQQK
ncbi:MAG: DNA-binding protein [Rickettsiaceae bacterium]|nr:MAG: DNA-binding protein [Rickettsiaceae bacterium]